MKSMFNIDNTTSDIEMKSIGDHIVHISMKDKNSLASAMARFQEYYESPFDDIRGHVFTLGYLKSKGSRDNPRVNTYCGNNIVAADWDGYNFPSKALTPFIQGLFDPLTPYEQAIVEMLRYRTDTFYVIATYGDQSDSYTGTIEHEIRHALYGTCPAYKKEVDKALESYSTSLLGLRECLANWGYHESVLDDECHAYMGADHDYFFENFEDYVKRFNVKKVPRLRDKLNGIATKYKNKLKLKY